MEKYILKYWYEHGGTCLWSSNEYAKNKFGYAICNEKLPLSKELIEELYSLESEYHTYLDWNDPSSPSQWTPMQKNDFKWRANKAYRSLVSELGSDFEIINEVDKCI